MKKQKLFNLIILTTIFFTIFMLFIFSIPSFALGDPQIVGKINSAFEKIEEWLLKISTPAAAVAVGTGVFMRKFSFR